MTDSAVTVEARPWKLAMKWLLFLAPLFFASYNFANYLAAQQAQVNSIVFDWERHIPFLPWTILPYWSIDILYGLSLFVCLNKIELNALGRRLLTTQVIAVCCFIALPLHFTFERPETVGMFGALFVALTSFDLPYNQAPSLHIALLVILWVHFPKHLPRWLLWPFHLLCIAILFSVLTTYQHHFIDVPTGALLGFFAIWLWPDNEQRGLLFNANKRQNRGNKHYVLASYYAVGSIILAGLAWIIKAWALWLLWPSFSLLMVAIFYGVIGDKGFEKRRDGALSMATKWLLFPYLIGAFISCRLFTRNLNKADHIINGVWLGRFPTGEDLKAGDYRCVLDLTAEFSAPSLPDNMQWLSISNLDLVPVSISNLVLAADFIQEQYSNGPMLVVCALGYSRSSSAIIAWLVKYGHCENVEQAIGLIKECRPNIVLNTQAITRLKEFEQLAC